MIYSGIKLFFKIYLKIKYLYQYIVKTNTVENIK
jgi:hypothetical protein